jgi:hypothetical protein
MVQLIEKRINIVCRLDCPALPPPDRARKAMRETARFFESIHSNTLDQFIDRLNINNSTLYPTFVTLCSELFKDGVNWGRAQTRKDVKYRTTFFTARQFFKKKFCFLISSCRQVRTILWSMWSFHCSRS